MAGAFSKLSVTTRVPPVTAERSPPASRINGGRLAGNRGFVHRSDPFQNFAVGWNQLTSRNNDDVCSSQLGTWDVLHRAVAEKAVGDSLGSRLAQRVSLSFAAPFGHRFSKVGKQSARMRQLVPAHVRRREQRFTCLMAASASTSIGAARRHRQKTLLTR
jgi:hypothetical protein